MAESAKPRIAEVIVVEGRDDTAAILRAVEAITIETDGYGIARDTWERLEAAYRRTGLIIFTDPDHAGRMIRHALKEHFPQAKHAYLTESEAEKAGDIGIENAAPADIRRALQRVGTVIGPASAGSAGAAATASPAGATGNESAAAVRLPAGFTREDLLRLGLAGEDGAAERREALGKRLGIGYGNAKTFLKRLNALGISREELEEALKA